MLLPIAFPPEKPSDDHCSGDRVSQRSPMLPQDLTPSGKGDDINLPLCVRARAERLLGHERQNPARVEN